jgi:hypothetical protein
MAEKSRILNSPLLGRLPGKLNITLYAVIGENTAASGCNFEGHFTVPTANIEQIGGGRKMGLYQREVGLLPIPRG